jgi:hypothetical protein
LDLLLELIALFFGGSIYKKAKKWIDENIKKKNEASKKSQIERSKAAGQTSASCTGCNRILKDPPVYEQGKPWCSKCYKTQVLKLR